jgi:toxin-antitoxin system PIN domain toxin
MTAYLLDVNVLISLAWPEHVHYARARAWFARNSKKGWATCPLVEAGFVRIVANPAFSLRSVSTEQAIEALRSSFRTETHQFWPDSISFPEAARVLKRSVRGHQRITDAYLVALAMRNRGKLATLDRGIAEIAPTGVVEVIA